MLQEQKFLRKKFQRMNVPELLYARNRKFLVWKFCNLERKGLGTKRPDTKQGGKVTLNGPH